jgi:predicted phosphoribosyltransferase
MFKDRSDAGLQLANALAEYKGQKNTNVMALPRGGAVPGQIIASALALPLGLIMVKKIGHPFNSEYAIGAVSLTSRVVDEHPDISPEYIEEKTRQIREALKEKYRLYFGNKAQINLKDKSVIVVDDGVATGKTMMAAIELLRKEKVKEIIVAIPVAPKSTLRILEKMTDKLICLESYTDFYAIGLYYEHFEQVSDEEVKNLLGNAENALAT